MNNRNKKGSSDIKYITLFALCFLLLGFYSALITGDTSLYGQLNNPPLSPPPQVFAIVWSVLYVLIGGVVGAVYSYNGEYNPNDKKDGLLWAYIGFLFNLLWYPLYFGNGQLLPAAIDIVVILLLNFVTFKYFYRIKPIFAYLLIPYIIWLLFALYLNIGTVILN